MTLCKKETISMSATGKKPGAKKEKIAEKLSKY